MGTIIVGAVLPVDEEELLGVERRTGVTIPPEYREFILSHNGGSPVPADFLIYDRDGKVVDEDTVQGFYGVKTGVTYNDIERTYGMFLGRMPSTLLPIAEDPGGNQICICVSGEDIGKMFFWDHEKEVEEGETPTYDNVSFLANSLHEFLDALTGAGVD